MRLGWLGREGTTALKTQSSSQGRGHDKQSRVTILNVASTFFVIYFVVGSMIITGSKSDPCPLAQAPQCCNDVSPVKPPGAGGS